MARPKRQTVDYFPHYATSGRTIYILESLYGNDGYAFWFKLLEILSNSNGHFYDCSIPANWQFLLAKTHIKEDIVEQMIKTLIEMDKIDAELWDSRVIWVQHLVDNLTEVYKKRTTTIPHKPKFGDDKHLAEPEEAQEAEEPQEPTEPALPIDYQSIVNLWNSICSKLPKVSKLTDARRQKIKSRLNEMGQPYSWNATIEALFEQVAKSDFLCGTNNNKWNATFDWLFSNESNWVKVMEGNYDNTKSQQGGSTHKLGYDERIENGRRTYGTGRITVPDTAPPRPGDKYAWNETSQSWILL